MSEQINTFPELDDLVRKFSATNLDRTGVVTGWVLCVASSRIDDDGDLCHAFDYSVGPDTDLMRAVGLIELCRGQMAHQIHSGGASEPTRRDEQDD